MKYSAERRRTIAGINRISTPGLRVYRKSDTVPRVLGGLGVAVLSTSQGLMTDREARKRKVGGEVLCYVWLSGDNMSRIGKALIPVPSGVDVSINGSSVTVKGPKGTLSRDLVGGITVRQDEGNLVVERPND